ncbi:MAG: hypothetical protein BXU00_01955 [Candidatus Nanoclepta minutus]|uniref:Uncharacterized protein n=1 Tax=Candidatus Nanoclepta minutus TaxID=1940235 RepID=A0A397WMH3_9ARCH|nr:MAG: hypothetical protein BXU00_01955 [Candidatus Nanoclepta minutus]
MKRLIILLVLILSIVSLLIFFPVINRENTNENFQKEVFSYVEYAKNLCNALCLSLNNTYDLTGSCLSDRDTITGKYWTYPNISCYVESNLNPCIDKGIVEIELFNNCSIKKVSIVNET